MEDRQNHSLYDPRFEHDACGIGAVVDLKGGPSHQTVSDALSIVEKLRHRAGRDAAGETTAIIGGGPAGMAAAWHLNRRGHLVTVYDKGSEPGGQLLQIPNNQLPPEIVRRRVRLMEEEGVVFKCGVTANAEELSAQYDTVVCCTGPKSKKESLVVLAIAQGKAKAAQADMDLMGFTSIEI